MTQCTCTWCIALKNDRIFYIQHNLTIRNYLQPISKLWNHSWYIEIGDFMVHWSKNTPFVTIWVTLWTTAFCEEKAKVFYITLQHFKEFYHFIAKLVNKSHSPQWEFGQHFSNFGTKICKNRIGRRISHLWEFLKVTLLLMWGTPESCNRIPRSHLKEFEHTSDSNTCTNTLVYWNEISLSLIKDFGITSLPMDILDFLLAALNFCWQLVRR